MNQEMKRATGLLILEVINSNPNGDPDQDSDPRQRPDRKGEISPVSFKRKLRDLIEEKEGLVWQMLQQDLQLNQEQFQILESRGRDRDLIGNAIKDGTFKEKYWDARIFGSTFLQENKDKKKKETIKSIKTGVVQFALGLSVAPVEIERHTNTNKAGVQSDKDRGMAPMAYRFVPHGVYCMPFFVNPSMAPKTGCTPQDIQLLLKLIPHAYAHTRSYVRPFVEIHHAWYMEHQNPLGSCSDFSLIRALTPSKKDNPDQASSSIEEYEIPTKLPEDLQSKISSINDLMMG